MRALCLPLVLAAALAAQDMPGVKKPDPVKKACQMLDAAAEMLGGVQPQIQVAGLWHLAELPGVRPQEGAGVLPIYTPKRMPRG